MKREEVAAIFLLSGLEAKAFHELANQYWPDHPDYADIRRKQPWWLVQTPFGLIRIGWRKRVIAISWTDTTLRFVVTKDDVTKDETMVHAWTYAKAVEYITELRHALNRGTHVQEVREPANA